jgi:ERCC4-type nuclease
VVDAAKPSVVADHREFVGGVPGALEAIGVSVTRATLRVGDYTVGIHTRVERKTVTDLHLSVATGRFWGQLNRLRAVSEFPVILVEGRDLDAGPLSSNGIRGVLVALADRGIPVLRSTDPQDSARWIRSLALSRSRVKRVQVRAPYRRPVGRRDPVAAAMLSAVPMVSLRTARELMDAFGTLRRIANASAEELSAVRGVGERRSEALYDAFNHRF